jgi:hypothetical protein
MLENQLMDSSMYPDIVCLSHLRWNWVFQRPQHLLIWAAKQACSTCEDRCLARRTRAHGPASCHTAHVRPSPVGW